MAHGRVNMKIGKGRRLDIFYARNQTVENTFDAIIDWIIIGIRQTYGILLRVRTLCLNDLPQKIQPLNGSKNKRRGGWIGRIDVKLKKKVVK